ncbi:hypothetical protein ACMGE9_12320 [Macrococcus sp. EM39E]|uniref:hypothetical protein n=1 Tax=Macrococcus animalis TaxID=3395467 RepID=UPI0039BDEDFC
MNNKLNEETKVNEVKEVTMEDVFNELKKLNQLMEENIQLNRETMFDLKDMKQLIIF